MVEFHDHIIWNHREKYIQKSTNMPGIGSLIREIDVNNQKFEKAKIYFYPEKPMPRAKCQHSPRGRREQKTDPKCQTNFTKFEIIEPGIGLISHK